MDFALKDKIALITGSSGGLGKAIALSLAQERVSVIICGRNDKNLKKTESEINKLGVKVYKYSLEATNSKEVKKLFSKIVAKIGRLDILVNNIGGVEKFGSFFDLFDDDWRKAFELNFMTMVYFTREAMPWLKKSDCGRIINISSVPARQPGLFNPHYSASKAAVLNLSKYLSNILAKDNVLVNTVCPGTLAGGAWKRNITDRSRRLNISLKNTEGLMRRDEQNKVPLGRIATLEEVANIVTFLASEKASFITGTCIDIDGGVVKSIL